MQQITIKQYLSISIFTFSIIPKCINTLLNIVINIPWEQNTTTLKALKYLEYVTFMSVVRTYETPKNTVGISRI